MNVRSFLFLFLPAVAVPSIPAPGQSTGAQPTAHTRWAIVSSSEQRATGVADLLTAELSRQEGIELVDRDAIRTVLKELELTAVFGSKAAAQRLELGRILQADALVLLAGEQQGQRSFVRLVVSDCRLGARLHVGYLSADSQSLEQIASQCAEWVRRVRQRYAGGVRRIVAVAPLVSENLTHDYDYLETAYARLLQSSLLSMPGVAVLEIEEARHIAEELQKAGERIGDRVVPLMISGRFKMSTPSLEANTRVRFWLQMTSGQDQHSRLESGELGWSEAVTYLARTATLEIARVLGHQAQNDHPRAKPLLANEQSALLLAQAAVFSELGQWQRAADLREAALLLAPDLHQQRLNLIADYAQALRDRIGSRDHEGRPLTRSQMDRQSEERQTQWRAMLLQVERVIRDRQVNPREADVLVRVARTRADHTSGMGIESWRREPPEVQAELGTTTWRQPKSPEIRRELRSFFRAVLPLFPSLDPSVSAGTIRPSLVHLTPESSSFRGAMREYEQRAAEQWTAQQQYDDWIGHALEHVVKACWTPSTSTASRVNVRLSDGQIVYGRHIDPRGTREVLYHLLMHVRFEPFSVDVPEVVLDSVHCLHDGGPVVPFLKRLEATGNPSLVYAAGRLRLSQEFRELKLALAAYHKEQGSQVPWPESELRRFDELDKKVEALIEFVQSNGYETPARRPKWDPHADLAIFRIKVASYENYARRSAPVPRRFTPLKFNDDSAPIRVAFFPIPAVSAPWTGLIKCRDDLDVMWSPKAVYSMPAKGQVRTLLVPDGPGALSRRLYFALPKNPVRQVAWDGENIWAATDKTGLILLSPDGKQLARVDKDQGLPPYGHTVVLHAVEPGRCFVIGTIFQRYGDVRGARVWFASVWYRPQTGSCQVRIVHRATKTADQRDAADQAFFVSWTAPWTDPKDPQRRLLMVGRRSNDPQNVPKGFQRHPLLVDLDSGQVTVMPGWFPSVHSEKQARFVSIGGRILAQDRSCGPRWVIPPERGAQTKWTSQRLLPDDKLPYSEISPWFVLCMDGQYYLPGLDTWWRFDPSTSQTRRYPVPVLDQSEPYPCVTVYYGVSAHYGVVAWNPGRTLHRVEFDPQLSKEEEWPLRYPHVPAADLARHVSAVQEIRRLGGQVGRWVNVRTNSPEGDRGWHTKVQLPSQWRGGDEGLRLLADLHDVSRLYIIDAPLTGEAAKYIGTCTGLERLAVSGTMITDADLGPLENLKSLERLSLATTPITPQAFERLKAALPSLKVAIRAD